MLLVFILVIEDGKLLANNFPSKITSIVMGMDTGIFSNLQFFAMATMLNGKYFSASSEFYETNGHPLAAFCFACRYNSIAPASSSNWCAIDVVKDESLSNLTVAYNKTKSFGVNLPSYTLSRGLKSSISQKYNFSLEISSDDYPSMIIVTLFTKKV